MNENKTLKEKILSDYNFYKSEEAEKFSRKAYEFITHKLKEFGMENVDLDFDGKVTTINSTFVSLFNVKGEDLTFGVSESMGKMMLFIVLRCKQCGFENWEFIFSKDDLGYEFNEFKIHHKCESLAESIAQDIDRLNGNNDLPSLEDLMGCDGNCEECGEKEKE